MSSKITKPLAKEIIGLATVSEVTGALLIGIGIGNMLTGQGFTMPFPMGLFCAGVGFVLFALAGICEAVERLKNDDKS